MTASERMGQATLYRVVHILNPFGAQRPTDPTMSRPFVVVLGLHSSGSSALAGVLYHLGVHLGKKLGGHYGNDPSRLCGFEERELAKFCERMIPFPSVQLQGDRSEITAFLRRWVSKRCREAYRVGTIAGGKYPQMCRLGDSLREVVGDYLRVIHINRPLNESILSVQRRSPDKNAQQLAVHQAWLWEGKSRFLAKMPREDVLEVEYSDLLSDPQSTIAQVVKFLDLSSTAEQISKAVDYVDPNCRHVFSGNSQSLLKVA